MSSSRRSGLLVASLCLVLLPLALAPTAGADKGKDPVAERRADDGLRDAYSGPDGAPTIRDGGPLTNPGGFTGLDGRHYDHAPLLVNGKKGTRYYGEEFDAACGYGAKFAKAVRRLQQLARVIEQGGRRVVFTIGPNKTAVNAFDLRTKRLPHGKCDLTGIQQQNKLLDGLDDPRYLAMRAQLAKEAARSPKGRDLYWPVDTHWTSLSTAKYAVALAERLSPRLAKAQSFRRGKETIQTDLSTIGLIPEQYETGPARYSTTKVDVTLEGDEYHWSTKPGRLTWPGRTLLIGDSFTYRALDAVRPLFRHARFLWIADGAMADIAATIPQSDTVVLEVVQRWLPLSPLTSRKFKRQVARALRG